MGRGGLVVAIALSLIALSAAPARALTLEQVGTYAFPVYVTSPPDDPSRLFVVERGGVISQTYRGQTSTFLDFRSLVAPPGLEDYGAHSLVFAPDFATSGRFYVAYAGAGAGAQRIDEFTANGDSASLATRRPVLEFAHSGTHHYGGQLQFGPDGYLYVSTGDNGLVPSGPGADPEGNGQNLESPHGKLLRIDPRQSGPQPYTVPADNPFVGVAGLDEIWSYGLRNPWRFSFDRATGDLAIADVGQDAWEEIEYAPRAGGGGRGDNYGWNCREGPDPYSGCMSGPFTEPAFAYPASGTGGCTSSVIGGYVVRDPGLPSLLGRYVFADFCHDQLRSVKLALPSATDDRLVGAVSAPTSFGEDACGRVYVTTLGGPVYRLVEGAASDCEDPSSALYGKLRQVLGKGRRVSIAAWADEAATLTLTARVTVQGAGKSGVGVKPKTVALAGAGSRRVVWKLGRRAAERFTRKLEAGRRVTVRFGAVALDKGGNASLPVERSVRLVLPR